MQWQERGSNDLGFTERDFKVCDLCGALNPVENRECFICGWRGSFHTDRETVEEAMRTVESHYGDLNESLFEEESVPSTPPRPSLWEDLWEALRKLLSRD